MYCRRVLPPCLCNVSSQSRGSNGFGKRAGTRPSIHHEPCVLRAFSSHRRRSTLESRRHTADLEPPVATKTVHLQNKEFEASQKKLNQRVDLFFRKAKKLGLIQMTTVPRNPAHSHSWGKKFHQKTASEKKSGTVRKVFSGNSAILFARSESGTPTLPGNSVAHLWLQLSISLSPDWSD